MHNVLPPVDSGSSWCDSRSMGLLQPGSSFHTLIPRFPSQKHRTRPISRVLGPATARASQPRPTGEDCLGALHAPDAVPGRQELHPATALAGELATKHPTALQAAPPYPPRACPPRASPRSCTPPATLITACPCSVQPRLWNCPQRGRRDLQGTV